jgi:uncharacterized protein
MNSAFFDAVRKRRSVYALSKNSVLPEDSIVAIVREAVKHTPSSYNSQAGRVVVLFGEQHNRLWDITRDILKGIVPADQFKSTEDRMDMFRGAYGTIMFFEDQDVVKSMQERFPAFKDKFPQYSEHSTGMMQYIVWTALAVEGIGASLQHYSPLIDDAVRKEWDIPASWKFESQMVFGKIEQAPGDKEFAPLDARVKVFR